LICIIGFFACWIAMCVYSWCRPACCENKQQQEPQQQLEMVVVGNDVNNNVIAVESDDFHTPPSSPEIRALPQLPAPTPVEENCAACAGKKINSYIIFCVIF
jgi:hypothetical protein